MRSFRWMKWVLPRRSRAQTLALRQSETFSLSLPSYSGALTDSPYSHPPHHVHSKKPAPSLCVECKGELSSSGDCPTCKKRNSLTAGEVFDRLAEFVIGQDHVKKRLAVSLITHLAHVRANDRLKQIKTGAAKKVQELEGALGGGPLLRRGGVEEGEEVRQTQQPYQTRESAAGKTPVLVRKNLDLPGLTISTINVTIPGAPSAAQNHEDSWAAQKQTAIYKESNEPLEDRAAVSVPPPRSEEEETQSHFADLDERLRALARHNVKSFDKANVLLLGPTGSGKTLLARTLAEVAQVPLALCDATTLTAAGYVGDDVETILSKLLESVNWDVRKAERGIVYLDEVDKIAKRVAVRHVKDVGGESVQHGLLKMLEGSKVSVPKRTPGSQQGHQTVTIDTTNILFICAGAFTGIEAIVAKRTSQRELGFGGRVSAAYDEKAAPLESRDVLLRQVDPTDLIEFGLIPEFVGRFAVVTSTNSLKEEDLIRILTQPTNAVINQMKSLFSIIFPKPVDLIFTDDALRAIAKTALKRGSGARGLRTVVENLVHGLIFDLPRRPHVTNVVVDEKVVLGERPCLEFTPQQYAEWQASTPSSQSYTASAVEEQQPVLKMKGVA